MEKSIEFQVQVKTKDLWQFSMYHTNRGAIGIFNLIFTAAALFLLITDWYELSDLYRFTMVFCALLFTVLQPLMLWNKARRQSKQPTMKEAMVLEFGEEGLKVRQLEQEAVFTWDQIGRITRRPKMIIVFMARNRAFLIPKEFFNEQDTALAELLHKYLPGEKLRGI